MIQDLWVKDIETPTLKPLSHWRNELYGFWMVYTDTKIVEGEKMVVVRYYGTDKEKLYAKYKELRNEIDEPTVGIVQNMRSNWLGGVFLAKAEG